LAHLCGLLGYRDQIYNDDLAVRMLLVDGTDTKLNFDTAAEMTAPGGPCGDVACFPDVLPNDEEDPDTGEGVTFGSANAYCYVGTLIANDLALSRVVGAANFDIGHIALGNDGGGIAGLGVVGNFEKAEG
jgi:hypothetical protein